MPRQANPDGLPRAATAPEVRLATAHITPMRTYSRRSLKRRHTSPSAQHVGRFLTRTGSLNVTEQKTAEQRSEAQAQQLSRPSSNKGRKRVGFSTSPNKTPNDLAWKTLASSARVLTRQDDGSPYEGEPDEIHIVKCSPGHKGSEHHQPPVENALNGPTKGRERKPGGDAASEADASENGSLEQSDNVEDGSEELGFIRQTKTTGSTWSSEGEGISIPTTSTGQKRKARSRFMIFDRSPPKGFKVLQKPRVNPEGEFKKRKRLTDGFTEDEARPIFLGKRRRLQHLDINVGSLDLTQTGIASQEKQKDISPEAKMRPQTRTAAGLWRGRQYFSASQFETEPQDSVEFSEAKITPVKCHKIELDSFCPIVIPRTDSPRPENTSKTDTPSETPDELVRDSSPRMHLLPKRSMNRENVKMDSLALRPGPPSWPKSDFVVPDTPLLRGDTSP